MSGSLESVLTLVVAILIAYAVVLWIGTAFWTYRDIRSRTQDGWTHGVSVLLVLVFNLPGLLLYLVVRPRETLNEAYERRMEAEALMRDLPPAVGCPTCRQAVREDFLVCPNCQTRLREACTSCSKALELSWSACPYCSTPRPKAAENKAPPPPKPEAAEARPAPPPSMQPREQSQSSPPPPPHPAATQRQPARGSNESTAQALWRRIVG